MAKASEHFHNRTSPLGVVALVCGAIAVLSANLSAIVPQNVLKACTGHASRAQPWINCATGCRMRRRQRPAAGKQHPPDAFCLAGAGGNEVVQRVGALEVSLPKLLEAMPNTGGIDPATTASIGEGDAHDL